MKIRRGLLRGIASVAAAAAMVLTPAMALAAGPGGGGRGGGGGGGGGTGETTVGNNLSVPAVFIGDTGTFALQNTTGALVYPTGDPSTGFEVPGSYYVQGVHTWQAQYVVLGSDTVTAKWGDNLTGSAMKRVGHQIRVEMGLTSTSQTALQGFSVIKLNGSQADNVSPWGTLATLNADGITYSATAATMPAKVWVAGAQVKITSPSGNVTTADMPGEINASGAVTFGYNWKPTETGTYKLEFLVPSTVSFTNPAATILNVAITGGGGGGGGGGRGGGR